MKHLRTLPLVSLLLAGLFTSVTLQRLPSLGHWRRGPVASQIARGILRYFPSLRVRVFFVFSQLAGNCSHVIHSIDSYSYLSLPVGLNWPIWVLLAAQSVDLFYVRHLPTLVLGCLLRAIEAEPRKPILTLGGIDPVRLFTGGWLRAKVHVHRVIGILLYSLVCR